MSLIVFLCTMVVTLGLHYWTMQAGWGLEPVNNLPILVSAAISSSLATLMTLMKK